ncbi:M42 family metallopeptidase [Neobacillus sp. PS3-34]|uniref:M42 family metallopeptidase n=1 Tax=Neobacillus sp. PS3-34 TaxID=3070678 RepID=UPI0027E0C72B|nr:M42 family metallopeptidase [Neobacillus sp. PS3-34]WML47209.1 M42 family metallopeptidase [Neobacillus sp. PS3-34]
MFELLKELALLHGPSGFEQPVVSYLNERLKDVADQLDTDSHGNIIARKKGNCAAKIIITAHMDEVGFIIRKIEENGLLRFEQLGGHDERVLPAQKVQIRTKSGMLTGIIGTISAHYKKFEQDIKVKRLRDLYIDVGASSRQQAVAMGINIGDPVTWLSSIEFLGNETTGKLVGKGFDDRAGCAVVVKVLEELTDFAGEIIAIFTVQEEVGLRGAKIAVEGISADVAVAVDTTAASDTPEGVLDDFIQIGQGTGIKIMDASLIAHPAVKDKLAVIAQEESIDFQYEVFPGIGTDGGAIHLANSGIPTGVLSIPSRNAHSAVEVISIKDLEGTKELLKCYISSFKEEEKFLFIDNGEGESK